MRVITYRTDEELRTILQGRNDPTMEKAVIVPVDLLWLVEDWWGVQVREPVPQAANLSDVA